MQSNIKEKKMEGIRKMIQVQTELNVADNTGARRVECIKVYVKWVVNISNGE